MAINPAESIFTKNSLILGCIKYIQSEKPSSKIKIATNFIFGGSNLHIEVTFGQKKLGWGGGCSIFPILDFNSNFHQKKLMHPKIYFTFFSHFPLPF